MQFDLAENRRYARDNVTCSRKDMFFLTLHVVTFIAVGAIIAVMASSPKETAVFNAAPVQEGRVGKGECRVEVEIPVDTLFYT